MRVSELYAQVAGLGFEKAIEDDDIFYQAVNRGVLQVNAYRPRLGSLQINHRPLDNLLGSGFAAHERWREIIFEATDARAYYFECDGNGTLYIEKESEGGWSRIKIIPLESGGTFKKYYGFIKDGTEFVNGRVRLRFAGEYLYTVRFVAMYEHIYSASEEDIPHYEPFTRYDLSTLADDFIALNTDPIDSVEGVRLTDREYDVEGGQVILLAHDAPGCYNVSYRRAPRTVENTGVASEDDAVIDLDEELCSLLVLITGVYIWCDDEPEKAEYYLNLYRERAAEIAAQERNKRPVRYNRCGW